MTIRHFYLLLISLFICQTSLFGQKREVKIAILSNEMNSEAKKLLGKLEEEIRSVVGEDANVSFPEELLLVNNNDVDLGEEQYQTILASDADIILAFGISNFKVMQKHSEFPKPIVLFGNAPVDFFNLDPSRKSSGINNLSYVLTTMTYKEDLQTFYDIFEYQYIGIAVEKSLHDVLPFDGFVEGTFEDKNAKFRIIPFETEKDIISNLDSLDALYMSGGFLLSDLEIKDIADTLISLKIPSFTATHTNDVASGLMASNQSIKNDEVIFRRLALSVEAIINGVNPSDLPLYLTSESQLSININTVDALGLSLRYSLMARTTIVGDLDKVSARTPIYDLPQVINEALSRNLELQANYKNVELQQQDYKAAKSKYLPNLTGSLTSLYTDPEIAQISNGQNPEYQTYLKADLQQVIYDPDASMNVRIQQDLNKAEIEQYNADQLDLIFNVSNAYFNILLAKSKMIINEQNLELTKSNLRIAEQNFEAGQSGKPDVLRFRSQLAQNTQDLIESVNEVKQATFDLNQLLNYDINRRISVEDVNLNEGVFEKYNYDEIGNILDSPVLLNKFRDFLISEAYQNAPELKALEYSLSATERSLKRASGGRFAPSVALSGQYQYMLNRSGVGTESLFPGVVIPDQNYFVGLNLNLPIFQSNIQNINRQTATIQKEQIFLNEQNLRLGIERNLNVSILGIVNQITNLEVSKVSASTALESLELTQESYSKGAVNLIQLIDAQTNYLQARIANATASYSYLISVLRLERTISYFFLTHTEEENEAFTQRFTNYLLQGN
jgi:outer membrane protein TolC